jgi:hypothetical protein
MGEDCKLDDMFGEAFRRFNEEIACLKAVSDGFAIALQETSRASQKKLIDFVRVNAASTKEEKEDGSVSIELQTVSQIVEFNRLAKRLNKYDIASRIIRQNSIVNLIICLDNLIGKLAKGIHYAKPETLDASDKVLKFSELARFADIEAAREYVIESEIEALLRKSHVDQIEWFEKYFTKLSLKNVVAWQDFIEVCERRNAFVHCDGRVTDQYIKVCKENAVQLPTNCNKGSALSVDKKYFVHACDTISEVGNKLAFLVWRKFLPQGKHDVNLNTLAVDLIANGNYDLAIKFLDFLLNSKPQLTGAIALMAAINKAQAFKWQCNHAAADEIVDKIDWAPLSNEYKLVHAVLKGEYANATRLMKIIGSTSDLVHEVAYREWPIFREFRKTAHFLEVFNDIYKKPYTEITVDDEELKFKL